MIRDFLFYVRRYNIFANDYVLYVYHVKTDDPYRIVGKMYQCSFEKIDRIDFTLFSPERLQFWNEYDYKIYEYKEPFLSYDVNPHNQLSETLK